MWIQHCSKEVALIHIWGNGRCNGRLGHHKTKFKDERWLGSWEIGWLCNEVEYHSRCISTFPSLHIPCYNILTFHALLLVPIALSSSALTCGRNICCMRMGRRGSSCLSRQVYHVATSFILSIYHASPTLLVLCSCDKWKQCGCGRTGSRTITFSCAESRVRL